MFNHLLMQAEMQVSESLFLFVVFVSFQFNQLAQVLFNLTLLILSCAVMHDLCLIKLLPKDTAGTIKNVHVKVSCICCVKKCIVFEKDMAE